MARLLIYWPRFKMDKLLWRLQITCCFFIGYVSWFIVIRLQFWLGEQLLKLSLLLIKWYFTLIFMVNVHIWHEDTLFCCHPSILRPCGTKKLSSRRAHFLISYVTSLPGLILALYLSICHHSDNTVNNL